MPTDACFTAIAVFAGVVMVWVVIVVRSPPTPPGEEQDQ